MNNLKNLVWLCTRAYEKKYVYSLGDGKALPNELTTAEAKVLVQKAVDFGVKYFFITGCGGEPFLRRDLLEIIRYSYDHGLCPYVKTDGLEITEEIAKELASSNCEVIVSIAGLKDVDEKLRGKGIFDRSIRAAKHCANHHILFSLSVYNTKYVVNQIRALVSLAEKVGSRGFDLASLIPQPIFVEEQLQKLAPLEPTPAEHEKEMQEIYQLNKEKGHKINIGAYDIFYNRVLSTHEPSLKLESRCSVCHNLRSNEWLDILDDGKVYGCSPLGLVFGDIRKDTLKEIMNKLRASETVKKLADRRNLKGKCGVCNFKSICGGCRAKAYVYTGDMFAQDPLCAYQPKAHAVIEY